MPQRRQAARARSWASSGAGVADPTTTFADIQKFFRLLEDRITMRLTEESRGCNK
jgi:hypothetical protein